LKSIITPNFTGLSNGVGSGHLQGDTPKNAQQSEFSFAAGVGNGEVTDRSRQNKEFISISNMQEIQDKEKNMDQLFYPDSKINDGDVKKVGGTAALIPARVDTILEQQSQENMRSTENVLASTTQQNISSQGLSDAAQK